MIAGYRPRAAPKRIIMWASDVLLSFPALVLLISGGGLRRAPRSLTISLVLGFISIPVYARLTRAHTLTVNASGEFITGSTSHRQCPNSAHPLAKDRSSPTSCLQVLSYGLIAVGVVTIVVEGSLSFLGLSVSAPTPSWGGLIADGQTFLNQDPALVLDARRPCLCADGPRPEPGRGVTRLRRRHEAGGRSGL